MGNAQMPGQFGLQLLVIRAAIRELAARPDLLQVGNQFLQGRQEGAGDINLLVAHRQTYGLSPAFWPLWNDAAWLIASGSIHAILPDALGVSQEGDPGRPDQRSRYSAPHRCIAAALWQSGAIPGPVHSTGAWSEPPE